MHLVHDPANGLLTIHLDTAASDGRMRSVNYGHGAHVEVIVRISHDCANHRYPGKILTDTFTINPKTGALEIESSS